MRILIGAVAGVLGTLLLLGVFVVLAGSENNPAQAEAAPPASPLKLVDTVYLDGIYYARVCDDYTGVLLYVVYGGNRNLAVTRIEHIACN